MTGRECELWTSMRRKRGRIRERGQLSTEQNRTGGNRIGRERGGQEISEEKRESGCEIWMWRGQWREWQSERVQEWKELM